MNNVSKTLPIEKGEVSERGRSNDNDNKKGFLAAQVEREFAVGFIPRFLATSKFKLTCFDCLA